MMYRFGGRKWRGDRFDFGHTGCEVHQTLENPGLDLGMETASTGRGVECTGVKLHQLSTRRRVYMRREKGKDSGKALGSHPYHVTDSVLTVMLGVGNSSYSHSRGEDIK